MNKNITKVVLSGLFSFALSLSLGATSVLASAPIVMTMNVTQTSTTATFTGYFNGNGSSSTDTEFFWGTSQYNLQTQHQTGFKTQNSTFGNFVESVSGLSPNTQYYVQAVAKNTATGETKYATQVLPFKTSSSPIACNPTLTADTYSVTYGGSVSLRLDTTGCGNPTITSSNGTYSNTPVSGSTISSGLLYSTTTFTISAVDTAGVSHSSSPLTITVNVSTPDCVINSFTNYGSTSYPGAVGTLSWGTTGCDHGYIDNGVGTISPISNGTVNVYPSSTTTYTLYAYSSTGVSRTLNTTVYVNTSGGGYSGGYSNSCVIQAFNAASTTVNPGDPTSLTWSSYGCNYVTISNIFNGAYLKTSGSVTTGPIYYTTTYNIYGYGQDGNSVGPSVTIYVSGNNQPYYPVYSNPTPTTTYVPTSTNGNVYTSVATNIGSKSARLNGLITSQYPVSSYFEYGTNPGNLNFITETQTVSGNTMNFYSTVYVNPLTTYYFRAVANINGNIVKGTIVSFDTASVNSASSVTYATATQSSGTGSGQSGINLAIENKSDSVAIGDTVEYTIKYENNSGKELRNVTLSILFPQGYTLKQSSQGRLLTPNNMEVDLGNLASSAKGSVYVETGIGQATPINQTLLTTATLNYSLPNGTRDSTVAYILNHANGMSALGGFALGSGFFPTTIFGWLLTIIVIFAIILAARRVSRGSGGHGHGGHH